MRVSFRRYWKSVVPALCIFYTVQAHALPNADIVFVGQVPNPVDFATANSTFGNHRATVDSVIRGGDLFIRYRNGVVKNLTRAAGFGNSGLQGQGSIAVRDPAVSWDGTKVVFSMVVGAPPEQYQHGKFVWQIYEITALGERETPVITKVPRQPEAFNNVSPIYGSDDTIFFTSDRPRNGALHLYPQRDEYESTATNTGIWNLNPQTGDLRILDHAPSGAFEPIIDSFGRILYSRWDHLQRDQQASEGNLYGAFNFANERADAAREPRAREIFPEPLKRELIRDHRSNPHELSHFFPWQINQDGTGHETLNHIGRHELHGYFDRAFNDDDNLVEHFMPDLGDRQHEIENVLHISEDPLHPGLFFAVDAPESQSHAAGQVFTLFGPPSLPADQMSVAYITHRSTSDVDPDNVAPVHTGLYRDPVPLSDGSLVVSHTSEKRPDANIGSEAAPRSRYDFRLKTLKKVGEFWQADIALTDGINTSVSYFTPDILASYSGPLWELQPVELSPKARPAPRLSTLEAPEQQIFQTMGVDVDQFKTSLAERGFSLIVMRNVTSRDKADLQQPFNLRVFEGLAQTIKLPGKVYDVSHLQLFQGDQIRGYGGVASPEQGRRVLASWMHDAINANPNPQFGPRSAFRVGTDGSVAAIVPARRALTWQLNDPQGTPVIRERYWLTFQPGEIRVCAGCHGANTTDQVGRGSPTNPPQALGDLLAYLRDHPLPPREALPPGGEPSKRYRVIVKGPRGDRLQSGKPALITTELRNSRQGEQVVIQLSVNGQECNKAINTINLVPDGTVTLSGRTPLVQAKEVSLRFKLQSGGAEVAVRDTSIAGRATRAKKRATLKKRDLHNLCAQFASFK